MSTEKKIRIVTLKADGELLDALEAPAKKVKLRDTHSMAEINTLVRRRREELVAESQSNRESD